MFALSMYDIQSKSINAYKISKDLELIIFEYFSFKIPDAF